MYYVLPGPEDDLVNDIDDFLESPSLLHANVGVSVYSISKGEYLYKNNENKNFVPASVMKLFTSYAGLFFLGKDYRYNTELYYRGYISENGILDGDLIVYSNGDPTLSPRLTDNPEILFDKWIEKLDSVGIQKITGSVIGDATEFDNDYFPEGWQFNDLVYDFAAPVSPFNYYNNSYRFLITPSSELGLKANITAIPEIASEMIINETETIVGSSFSNIKINQNGFKLRGGKARSNYLVSGEISKNPTSYYKIKKVSVEEPEQNYLNSFKTRAQEFGIEIQGGVIVKRYGDLPIDYTECELIDENSSIRLDSLISIINSQSDNLLAETLLKTIAKEKTGLGNFDNGLDQISKLINDIGINSESVFFTDGSGLSRMNLLSPSSIVKLLTYIYNNKNFSSFKTSLAKPGKGTLSNRMQNTLASKNLWAKTGTMTNISNIAGFIETEDDEMLAFAIMFNNFTGPVNSVRSIQDLICMRLSAFTRVFKIEKENLKDLPISPSSPDNQ